MLMPNTLGSTLFQFLNCTRNMAIPAVLLTSCTAGIINAQPDDAKATDSVTAYTMSLEIDATDLHRKLLYGTTTIPVAAYMPNAADHEDGRILELWYPKWLPGTHGPGGPVHNIAGLYIENEDGDVIDWTREPGEVYKINVDVPTNTDDLRVTIRYITNQSTANSTGVDSFGSELIGFVSANTVMLYPDDVPVNQIMVTAFITLPDEWSAASALDVVDPDSVDAASAGNTIRYQPVSLERLVDSPIMAARYLKTYNLNEKDIKDDIPPHRLHIMSEAESVMDIPDDVHEAYQRMVTQTARLVGSHHFDSFDILLATTNALSRNGLEHMDCTFNVLGQRSMQSLKGLRGWDQMLLPHEYLHAWCGKYRRPAGMATDNFHDPKGTELLWVYEGLTQYLGEVIEARAGFLAEEEYEWSLLNSIRSYHHRQGRDWRPLDDTAAASHTLRSGSRNWSHLRRSQDYYAEGALLWMEADALIRNATDNAKSLDDFCHLFFEYKADAPSPRPFDRQEIIDTLNRVHTYDWDTFITNRAEQPKERFGLGLAKELGYQIQYSNTPPEGANNARMDTLDARDSIGATFSSSGSVRTVLLGSPADIAGLGPDMKIVGVGEYVWSRDRFVDAIADSVRTGEIALMLVSGDKYITKTIVYDGGPRFLHMVKSDKKNTLLSDILKPREK